MIYGPGEGGWGSQGCSEDHRPADLPATVRAEHGSRPFAAVRIVSGEMEVWRIWHPTYGVIYDEGEVIKRGAHTLRACNGPAPGVRKIRPQGLCAQPRAQQCPRFIAAASMSLLLGILAFFRNSEQELCICSLMGHRSLPNSKEQADPRVP